MTPADGTTLMFSVLFLLIAFLRRRCDRRSFDRRLEHLDELSTP